MATDNSKQLTTQPTGFWKIRHAVIGLGALLLVIVAIRGCGEDAEDEKVGAESGAGIPRQAIAVKIPAPEWHRQYSSEQQQAYRPPGLRQQQQPGYGYPQQQQPAYGYPQQPQQQQQPAYGYPQQPQQQQQPAYGYPQQPQQPQQPSYGYPKQQPQQPQQQPAYGYGQQQPQQPAYGYPAQPLQQQPQMPAADPGNPWAVQQQPGSGRATQPQWGRSQREPSLYYQPSGSGQYRPLDEKPHTPQQKPSVAASRPMAPYDRRAGSSFGESDGTYPSGGAYPGYYGTAPYGGVSPYGGWTGGPGGYPGVGYW